MTKQPLTLEFIKRRFNTVLLQKQLQRKLANIEIKPAVLNDKGVSNDDSFLVGDARLDEIGFVDHHISSFNDFVENGIKQIITKVFKVDRDVVVTFDDENTERIHIQVEFTDVRIDKPTFDAHKQGTAQSLTPNFALINNRTYSAALYIDAKVTATAYMTDGSLKTRTSEVKNKKICQMPVMVKSNICNLYKLSQESLMKLNEDPTDPGAYFIIKGVEWVIDSIENITYNHPRIYKNVWMKEIVRCEFISKPGDSHQNSDYIIIRLLNDGQITVEIRRDKLKDKPFPFFLIFKVLGWVRDEDIVNNIIYGNTGKLSEFMKGKLMSAFKTKYDYFHGSLRIHDQMDAMEFIANYMVNEGDRPLKYLFPLTKKENMQQAIKLVMSWFEDHFLPHIGKNLGSRHNKLRYLALMIRKIFLVEMGVLESTDRDTLKNKRIHPSGLSYAKAFKTYFNAAIVLDIVKKLKYDFRSFPFDKVNLSGAVETQVHGADFDKLIMQTITSGNKAQLKINRKRSIINRLSSQQLHRKNKLNTLATFRQITTTNTDSSKSSDRANEMRRVHPTFMGYICIIHSPEGEKVGINKQLAIFANICDTSNSEVIKQLLVDNATSFDQLNISSGASSGKPGGKTKFDIIKNADDDAFFLINEINHEDISKHGLNNVYVNGDWLGFTKNAIDLAEKFRKLRRGPNIKVDPAITIHWREEEDELLFWTDPGRLIRPLIVVYNNRRDKDKFSKDLQKSTAKFHQSTLLSADIIKKLQRKEISSNDLLENGVFEFISADEQENAYLCPDMEQLVRNRNNEEAQYTHCDIPQAAIGMTALTSPFANHNQIPRVIFQTSQAKQTCGYYALNWPHRVDKDTFLQYTCEVPLIRTVANRYMFPNGQNCMVAIAINGGYNQEDSIIVNQNSLDRGSYMGCKFTFYYEELEDSKEKFGIPDLNQTIHTKDGDYGRLTKKGYIPTGSIVNKGDIIIGKYSLLPKDYDSKNKYQDKSTVYKSDETAIVHKVVRDRNEDGKRFIKIALRKLRGVVIGDKFCVTEKHEVLTRKGWKFINELTTTTEIATLNPENDELSYYKPEKIHTYDHNGKMYKLESRHINITSTLTHKMYVREKNSEFSLQKAENIIGKKTWWKRNCVNTYADQEYFELPSYLMYKVESGTVSETISTRSIPMDAWLKFLGVYIAEGCIDNANQIRIYVHKDGVRDLIESVEEKLGLTCKVYKDNTNYYYSDIQIAKYLKQLGKSTKKYLPKFVWNLSQKQCRILLDAMLQSDGCNKGNRWEYCTSSEKLANDFQRLCIHSGWTTKIMIKNEIGEELKIKGIETTRSNDQYRMYVSKHSSLLEPLVGGSKTTEKIIDYKGKVYCPEVKHGIFMVRYKGTAFWTGNSSRAGLIFSGPR